MKYAHSLPDTPASQWQSLEDHLKNVAELAGTFASDFSSSSIAELLGLVHDIGKSRKSFERYLLHCNGLEDNHYDFSEHSHSGVGAYWLKENLKKSGFFFSYCVAGHHSGLTDKISLLSRYQKESSVSEEPDVKEWIASHEKEWKQIAEQITLPWQINEKDIAFWLRMLFSCLVDADFLDTEKFMSPERFSGRGRYPELSELSEKFFQFLDKKQNGAAKTEVNRIRAEIRHVCEKSAEKNPGIFSLTVPTGGGKTLSGMAFALLHAVKYHKKRIIYVIPYTSIIEQTSAILREIFGDENIVEHHSNFDTEKETLQSSLASENWDAPIIITTSVQFFESLYSSAPGKYRKLHNIANSVVILDEFQLLPVSLLTPCCDAINQLAEHYKTSFVLSTATQPGGSRLRNVTEIIPPEMNLFPRLKRVDVQFPEDLQYRNNWDDISGELCRYKQVLCIVNTRSDCRELWQKMPKGTIHLSALMCGTHRSEVIAEIKEKLNNNEEIRAIATSLVEAGVDIDFPVVYRAYTGLASVMQSAGRCNREGRLQKLGRTVVFIPPKASPVGEMRKAEDALTDILKSSKTCSLENPAVYPDFFQSYYKKCNDTGEVFEKLLVKNVRDESISFAEASEKFRMIDDKYSLPLIVYYGGNDALINELKYSKPNRILMRKLQRSTVNIPRTVMETFINAGMVKEYHPGIFIQSYPDELVLYDKNFGVNINFGQIDAEDLIC